LYRVCGSRPASRSRERCSSTNVSLARPYARAQRRGAEQECLLVGQLVLVEQDEHQSGPAAEPAEQRALAHAGFDGDVVHGHRVGSSIGDQPPRGVEQQPPIAGGIPALLRSLARHRKRLVGGGHA
jgi:hypothetical protein